MAEHPSMLSIDVHKCRLALICGDGQISLGGPQRRHPSTGRVEQNCWTVPSQLHGVQQIGLMSSCLASDCFIINVQYNSQHFNLMIPDFKGCAELLWRSVFEEGPLLCDWGLMHRQENALERSIKEVPAAREVMDLASVLDKTFCMGDGRALLRGVANQLEVQVPSLGAPGGTRQLTVTKQYYFLAGFMH